MFLIVTGGRRSEESDITAGAKAREKLLMTPREDSEREDNTGDHKEEDATAEGYNAGSWWSNRKTEVTANLDPGTTEEDGEEKEQKALTKHKNLTRTNVDFNYSI